LSEREGDLLARKVKHFADELIGGPEAGLCHEVVGTHGIRQIFVRDQRKIDGGARDKKHTPRMRSMTARSLCRSLTE
jgi:hypothetical protein